MLRIAHQVGSSEFERPLRRLGVPCRVVTDLRFGDFAFIGEGPHGSTRVGLERKTITEVTGLASWNRFRRHQLPGLVKSFDYRFVLVEGLTKVDKWGVLQAGKEIRDGQMAVFYDAGWGDKALYENYRKKEMTVRLKCGVHFLPTANPTETAFAIHAIYRWFQKPWADHHSHLQVDEIEPDRLLLDDRTFKRQVFAQFPGVGWKYSARVANYFDSVAEAVGADVDTWMLALGIVKGRKKATTLVAYLNGKGDRDAKG